MKITCPVDNKHKRFSVTAHEVHEWVVDRNGEFVKDLGCTEMSHKPEKGDTFICVACTKLAHGSVIYANVE